MIFLNKNRGFTLVEVLLVISIIGLIFSIIVANLQDARYSARDSSMKQQVRTTATLFEFQRNNNNGVYQNYLLGAVSNDGTGDTCADKSFVGEFAAKLEELCNGIVREAEYDSPEVLVYSVDSGLGFNDGNHFSIMVRLNTNEWYCVGSNGGTYQGTLNPAGNGCAANP